MQLLRRHPLISFFVMAYAISWTYVIVFLIVWPLPDTIVTDTPELLGPVVAGFVMTAVMSGRAGVRQLLRRFVMWRVGGVWYLYALLGMPALYLIAVALVPGALGSFKAPSLTMSLLYPVLFVVVLVLDGPLLEEPGWRGFALPRLQARWGPLVGTVILGMMWGAWHAPQYFTKTFAAANGGLSVSGVIVFLLAVVSFSVLITWAFNHTGGSLLIAILIHTAINFTQGLTSDLFPAAAYNEVVVVAVFGTAAAIVAIATRGRLGFKPATA
jgi:membrane protease YdiL (CAAX protease family)